MIGVNSVCGRYRIFPWYTTRLRPGTQNLTIACLFPVYIEKWFLHYFVPCDLWTVCLFVQLLNLIRSVPGAHLYAAAGVFQGSWSARLCCRPPSIPHRSNYFNCVCVLIVLFCFCYLFEQKRLLCSCSVFSSSRHLVWFPRSDPFTRPFFWLLALIPSTSTSTLTVGTFPSLRRPCLGYFCQRRMKVTLFSHLSHRLLRIHLTNSRPSLASPLMTRARSLIEKRRNSFDQGSIPIPAARIPARVRDPGLTPAKLPTISFITFGRPVTVFTEKKYPIPSSMKQVANSYMF